MTAAEIIRIITDSKSDLESELEKTESRLRAAYRRIDAHDDNDFRHPPRTAAEHEAREASWEKLVDAADNLEARAETLKKLVSLSGAGAENIAPAR